MATGITMRTASLRRSTKWHSRNMITTLTQSFGDRRVPLCGDNSIRSAYVHVIADAVVSILAITGLLLARLFGWLWMDPLAGIVGALVIANWSYGLIRDTSGILLDISPDPALTEKVCKTIESDGDRLTDLHLWRLGPGHLGVVASVVTGKSRDAAFYRAILSRFKALSHVTVEVTRAVR